MFSNRLAFAALGAACIAAAAGGGYLATRQNAVPAPAAAMTPESAVATPAPVQETEAVVGDQPSAKPAAPPVATPAATPQKPAPSKRDARSAAPEKPAATTQARHDSGTPTLDRTWPSNAGASGSTQSSSPAPAPSTDNAPSHSEDHAVDTPRAPEPPQKAFEELVVSADSVIGLQTDNRISSDTAKVEDRVEAHVTRDVKVGDRVAIPSGAKAVGSVMFVERGGKFKERARLGVRFRELVLADGTHVPISTDTIYRDGEAPGNTAAVKVGGGAIGGAILGAILGGAKGAAIGATVGAGGGAAVVQAGDRNAAVLPAGSPMTVRLLSPVSITTEK